MTGADTVSVNNIKTECVTLVTHLFSAYSLNVTFSLISVCKLKSHSIIIILANITCFLWLPLTPLYLLRSYMLHHWYENSKHTVSSLHSAWIIKCWVSA